LFQFVPSAGRLNHNHLKYRSFTKMWHRITAVSCGAEIHK
jgi:hypothetical protein